MEGTPESPSVDELTAQLQAKVEEREREGVYPPELVHDLQEHFRRISSQRSLPDLEELRARLGALDSVSFGTDRIPLESGMPGGPRLHALVARLVARQTDGVLDQVRELADHTRLVLHSIVTALEQPHGHVHADLVGQVDALFEQVAAFERGPSDSKAAVADLRRRVETLEAVERTRTFRPFFSRTRFEEHLRGTRENVVAEYRDRGMAATFQGCEPVLDLGCGRGELLELLRDEGVTARGVEADEALVDECRRRGLEVEHDDGLDFLGRADDGSLGGIALLRVVEHLTPQQVVELVLLAHEKLRSGGRLVVEAVDPKSAGGPHLDPTITQLLHPEYLSFVAREAGFGDIRTEPAGEVYVLVASR